MKTRMILLTLALALGLGGCAAKPEAVEKYPADLRSKYIHAIEKDADTRFTRVYWVRAPSNQELENMLVQKDDD